jgi:alpha/beta superfamily hydrolase
VGLVSVVVEDRLRSALDEAPGGARPVILAFHPDPVLAFLHESRASVRRPTAVLICPPFGWEETCTYRGQRSWAQALADAGLTTARLNLPSSGDSGGSPRDPGRLDSWTGAVAGAAAWLRETTGCERVVAIGIGLGGMLAYRALAEGAPIDDLVLWAVPSQGRLLLRELRARAGIVATRYADEQSPSPRAGDLELTGFLLSAETVRELEGLALTALELPDGRKRRALLLERDGLAVDKRLHEHLAAAGVAVSVEPADDYGAWIENPQDALAPRKTIANTIAWLSDAEAEAEARRRDFAARPIAARVAPVQRESMDLVYDSAPIVETPLRLRGGSGELFGVLSESRDCAHASTCAVLLNGGALRHIGPNRTWVETARRWAARGVPTVRIDLEGIGDSDGDERVLLPDRTLYASSRISETLSVMDQLSELGLPNRFVLGGLCSGAYWSLYAALADRRVAGALMVNMYAFAWSEELIAERETSRSLGALRGRGWRKLVRGDVSADQLANALASMRPGRIRTGAGHPVESLQREFMTRALDRLRDQGTHALLLLSRSEPLYDQLVRQGVLARLDRWPNLAIDRIPSRDHMFRALWLQRRVHESLDRGLERALGGASMSSVSALEIRAHG